MKTFEKKKENGVHVFIKWCVPRIYTCMYILNSLFKTTPVYK
jgi:hypothetical protein